MITFDGYCGAGKSYQSSKISNILKIPRFSFVDALEGPFRKFVCPSDYGDAMVSIFFRDLATIQAQAGGNKGWRDTPLFTVDTFFNSIFRLAVVRGLDLTDALDIFRQGICLNGGREPVASFYLKVPVEIAERQIVERMFGDSLQVENPDILKEDKMLSFYQWLEQELPYFYIVDGFQSKEAVTNDILEIMEKAQVSR